MPLPRELSCAEVAQRLRAAVPPLLLDVRNPDEHQYVALPGSLLIPLHELEERADELAVCNGREVVVYCHHGVRSLSGAGFLRALGHDATSMRGGIDRWAIEVDPALRRY